jgi:aminoglycoside phosphotransferase (APT) family kinase protein
MTAPTLTQLQPVLAGVGQAPVVKITRLPGGSAPVYRLDLADGTRLVLKCFDRDHLLPRKDQYAAGLLLDVDIVATRYLLVDESLDRLPNRFALTSYVEGERASTFADHPHYQDVMRELGALARKLHGIVLPAFGGIPAEGGSAAHATNAEYMRGYVDGSLAKFVEHGGDPAMAATLRTIIERDFDAVVPHSGPAVFAHSDLQPHNILVVEQDGKLRLSGLIDFGNMRAESAPMDLAKCLFCTEHDTPGSTVAILDGYGPINHPEPAKALAFYTTLHRLTMWSWLRKIGVLPSADSPSDIIDALRVTIASEG